MDVTRMTFADSSFDCVLDKATLDTMCQLDDDDEEEEETKRASRAKGGDDDVAKTKKKALLRARLACCASLAARFGRAGRTCA
jgi:hypothetical protein